MSEKYLSLAQLTHSWQTLTDEQCHLLSNKIWEWPMRKVIRHLRLCPVAHLSHMYTRRLCAHLFWTALVPSLISTGRCSVPIPRPEIQSHPIHSFIQSTYGTTVLHSSVVCVPLRQMFSFLVFYLFPLCPTNLGQTCASPPLTLGLRILLHLPRPLGRPDLSPWSIALRPNNDNVLYAILARHLGWSLIWLGFPYIYGRNSKNKNRKCPTDALICKVCFLLLLTRFPAVRLQK